MFVLTPKNQSALEHAVQQAAQLHESRASFGSKGFYTRFFNLGDFDASYPDLCVKYTDLDDIQPENSMLQYLYFLASEDGNAAPHVPRPAHFFRSSQNCWGYIVMGRIELREVSEQELHIKTAEAVQWLHSKGPPPGTVFGSIGNYARHRIFKDSTAPLMFTSIAVVETYLNTAVHRISSRRSMFPLTDISIVNEKVVLTQSDMDASNFGVALDGRPVIFDAITIQALPLSLANFTLLYTTGFSIAVSKHVFDAKERASLLESSTMRSLVDVGKFLTMTADDTLGLDDHGNSTIRRQN